MMKGTYHWLMVEPTPLKNMNLSVGMMTFPIYGKIKNVPNHQPDQSSTRGFPKIGVPQMDDLQWAILLKWMKIRGIRIL
jgi:hypothetical protein